MTEVHWRIVANLGFKFRSHFTAHCGRRAACGRIISRHASQCYALVLLVVCVIIIQKRREDEQKKLIELQQRANEMRLKEEARRRQEHEMNMLRETEDEFRQLQLKEQEQLDRLHRLSNTEEQAVVPAEPETLPTSLPTMPSAPPDAEPSIDVSPSALPDVLPPSYTSVVHVGPKPTIPSRDLKPTSSSLTYVL